jgi:hypothetical protein
MRSATIAAVSVVLVGVYLAIAGTVGLAPQAIAVGVSAIAVTGAIGAVVMGRSGSHAIGG